ncbi:MAG: hypothetical protein Gyms2KO_02990 [Gymnodinialimonas sp.]
MNSGFRKVLQIHVYYKYTYYLSTANGQAPGEGPDPKRQPAEKARSVARLPSAQIAVSQPVKALENAA